MGTGRVAPRFYPDPAACKCKVRAIVFGGDAEGFAKGTGPRSEASFQFPHPSSFEHRWDTVRGFYCTNQDCMRSAFNVGNDVEQGMDAIAEVNVGDTTRTEHDFGPGSSPVCVRVRSPILRACVGLCFNDDAAGQRSLADVVAPRSQWQTGKKVTAEKSFAYPENVTAAVKRAVQLRHTPVLEMNVESPDETGFIKLLDAKAH